MHKLIKNAILVMALVIISLQAKAAVINEGDINAAVKKEFVEKGISDNLELEFYGGQTFYDLGDKTDYKIMISALKTDEQQNKFSCRADIYANGKALATNELSGKYYRLDEIHVPARNIKKGETISDKDLKLITIRHNRIKNANVIEKEKLVNKEAKRMLKEGKIVVDNDIGARILMRKGDIVTAIYTTPHMQITTKAQVLSDGAKGDRIDLLNTKSKKTLYGEVIDVDTVKIDVQ